GIGCDSFSGTRIAAEGCRMWTPEHRRAADRHGLRYPSDLSDSEWALIEPAIPPAKRGGRRRQVNVREVLNAIFYVLSTGCQWQALPKDLPPKSTAHHYVGLWDWDGTLERVHHALYVETREQARREASPLVAIIDSQSGKAAQKGALRSTRRDSTRAKTSRAANGTSSSNARPAVEPRRPPANIQDRHGAGDLLRTVRRSFPFIERIFADAGYQ